MVYNEEKDLDEAIESIYEQNFDNIEILIGNNASTDNSTSIIEAYTKKDSRIVHINRKRNIGALQNWNDLVDRASGEYFVLAGGHDKWSLNYLKNLPIDILKIDKSFTNSLLRDIKTYNIVKTLINLAKDLDLKVIAEGVETEEQLKIYKKLNCDYVQGFFLSLPLPEKEMENLLKLNK